MVRKTKKNICCFRHWTRQGFAVFASLHKVVKICMVTFTCSLVQKEFQPVFAQADSVGTAQDVKLHEVEVTADPTLLWSEPACPVSIVSKKEIEALPVQSIDDILEKIPGVDIRQRGTDGVQSDISINGGSFDQVLILLNGINITDPQTGHYNLNLPVDISQIQKIEVLNSSGSRTIGPNAFSGAINIITFNNSQKPGIDGQVGVAAGSNGFLNGFGSYEFLKKSWQSGATVSYKKSDGYIENTDYGLLNCNFHVNYKSKNIGDFFFQIGYQQKDFGANSFYSFSYPNQFESTKTLFSALNWEKLVGNKHLMAQIYERRHHDRFELFRDMKNAASWYTSHNYHLTDVSGINIKLSVPDIYGKIIFGTELRNEHIFSNVLGETLQETKTDPFDENGIFTKAKNRLNYSAYFDRTFLLGDITISGGLNANLNNNYGFYWNGGSDISWKISREIRTWAGLNRTVRLPTFTDLYYKSATQISNPELLPETAVTFESGISVNKKKLQSSATIWYRWGNDIIDWVKNPDSTKWVSRNMTDVNAFGVSLSFEYFFGQGFFQSLKTDYNYQYLNKVAKGFDSKYALDYLRNKGNVSLSLKLYGQKKTGIISAVINTGVYDRAGTWTDFSTKTLKDYEPYVLCDTRIIWKLKKISVNLDAENLFNTKYADFGGLSLPGTVIRAGMKYSF